MFAEVHKSRSWPARALIVLTAPLWFPVWWTVGVVCLAWNEIRNFSRPDDPDDHNDYQVTT